MVLLAEQGVWVGPSLGCGNTQGYPHFIFLQFTPSHSPISCQPCLPHILLTMSSKKLSLTDVFISQKRKWLCREEITPPLGNRESYRSKQPSVGAPPPQLRTRVLAQMQSDDSEKIYGGHRGSLVGTLTLLPCMSWLILSTHYAPGKMLRTFLGI